MALSLSSRSFRANCPLLLIVHDEVLRPLHGELYSALYLSHDHTSMSTPVGIGLIVDLRTIFYNRCILYSIEDVPAARLNPKPVPLDKEVLFPLVSNRDRRIQPLSGRRRHRKSSSFFSW